MKERKTIQILPVAFIVFVVLLLGFSENVVNAFGATLIGSILSSYEVTALEYSPSNDNIYVVYQASDQDFVQAVDSSTNIAYAKINVGKHPTDIEYNPSNGFIYVTNQESNSISVIDTRNNTLIDTIPVEGNPIYIEYNPSNKDLYLTMAETSYVPVIDSSTNTVVDNIFVGDQPFIPKYNPTNHDIYVTTFNSSSNTGDQPFDSFVAVIDSATNNVVDRIGGMNEPIDIEFNPDADKVYVANRGSHAVTVIDSITNTVDKIVNLKDVPLALEYNDQNKDLYVTVQNHTERKNGFVAVIDGASNKVVNLHAIGIEPTQIKYNPIDNKMYVANPGSNDIYVLDGDLKSIDFFPSGVTATAIEYNPSNGNIYIGGNDQGGHIQVLSPNTTLNIHSDNLDLQKLVTFIKEFAKNPVNLKGTYESVDVGLSNLPDDGPENDKKSCKST